MSTGAVTTYVTIYSVKKQCEQCGEIFTFFEEKPGKNPRFCGNACRQRAYRSRKKLAEKTAEVNQIIDEVYPNGVPAEVSIAEQLDEIRDKIRADEKAKFDEKLAGLIQKLKQAEKQIKALEVELNISKNQAAKSLSFSPPVNGLNRAQRRRLGR